MTTKLFTEDEYVADHRAPTRAPTVALWRERAAASSVVATSYMSDPTSCRAALIEDAGTQWRCGPDTCFSRVADACPCGRTQADAEAHESARWIYGTPTDVLRRHGRSRIEVTP